MIVWASGGLGCQFRSPTETRFVDDCAIYERWVNFWKACCEKKELPLPDGKTAKRRDPVILEALRATGQGNYLLHEGGYLLESVTAADRQDATSYLYDRLVAEHRRSSEAVSEERDSLKDRSDAALQSAGITEREEFQANCPIALKVAGITQEFRFDYALNNGKPQALFQRVNLKTQSSTTNAAFLFECAADTPLTKRAMRFALLDAYHGLDGQTVIDGRHRILKKFCDVIDLSNHGEAVDRLSVLSESSP